jgi:serine/threonine protein kinase
MKRAPTPAPATPPKEKDVEELLKKVKAEYNLNGKTIGDGKYVLVGKQIRSSSTRSQIYYAYKSDSDGLPTGPRLTVKISPTVERLERESRNYDSITFGLFSGEFVKKLEFLPQAKGDKSFSRTASALVLQSGERNLRTLFDARGKKGLEGTAMRQAAVAIAQCIQAIHSSGLVWTDLKAENFVVISNSIGDRSIEGVKGIDLESAVPVRGSPIDYSPEACPPEFAIEEAAGRAADFILQFNYDIWSFGVLLYELSVGSSLFGMKKDSQITSLLRDKNFEPDTSAVPDERLRDLIDQCLQMNPQKRPGMTQILLHPYFLTTGIGPFSF